MTNELFHAAIWEKAWKEDAHITVKKMKSAGIDPAHSFDQKANTFNEEVFSEEGRRRAKRIMSWLEDQGVAFKEKSILDIGAASGGFSVPFAQRGANVTAVESSLPLVELMNENISGLTSGTVEIVPVPFEDIDIGAKGWEQAFDLVFVSMCPVLIDWESVEKVLSCAREFCYMSMSVGPGEHSLVDEVWPLITDRPRKTGHWEMGYLLHLLLLKGYAYQSLITREMKTKVVTRATAFEEAISMLKLFGLPADERIRSIVSEHLEKNYPADQVTIQQGGRFGKVLVRLQSQNMYSREEG
ncbi:tRNA 5-carboxymethoxyuridine methyltransferase [Paenibacillus plantiphilus]|uniref:tRNA 5-carboxymethoxyuridine methyltransferase n=1 Tax=Paenibacillus plantiphilus TaxID=2905650 RepID=A0ABM9C4C9_9BACL|nr:class I SAM-dependent methyltransferase [Paenibacillus plantiphilus]CAH1203759.1 tRNA 5-carboxymethoxyuridine methyltransferase [Paenibacillus plantiphilus]